MIPSMYVSSSFFSRVFFCSTNSLRRCSFRSSISSMSLSFSFVVMRFFFKAYTSLRYVHHREVCEKTIALYIKTGKLTAQTLQKAMKTLLAQMKKQKDKTPQGKQTLKQLMKQNAGVSNIEITEGNIKAFESTAKKYGIDFALKKDTTENPPRYLVFFKGRDADVLTAAFKEFSAKKLTQEKKPSIRKLLSSLKEKAAGLNVQRDKVKNKDREVSL